MKISIEHVEKSVGAFFTKRNLHGVQVHAQFSEAELSIIEQRGLKHDIVLERGHSADVSDSKAAKKDNRGLGKRLLVAAVSGADANTTHLTISKLMKGPDVFYLGTPLEAKDYEAELKERLVQLKGYITENEEVAEKTTSFEL